jgi:hypothetical protein
MKRHLLGLIALMGLALGGIGCTVDDLDLVLDEPDALPQSNQPLAESADEGEQAAGKTPAKIDRDRQAQEYLVEGLQNKDPGAIGKAIEASPRDPTYYAYQAALTLALRGEDDPAYRLAVSEFAWPLAHSSKTQSEIDLRFMAYFLPATLETRMQFEPGSDPWKRLQTWICDGRAWLQSSDEPLAPVILALNPDDTPCP